MPCPCLIVIVVGGVTICIENFYLGVLFIVLSVLAWLIREPSSPTHVGKGSKNLSTAAQGQSGISPH
jgi:hypothetical protein